VTLGRTVPATFRTEETEADDLNERIVFTNVAVDEEIYEVSNDDNRNEQIAAWLKLGNKVIEFPNTATLTRALMESLAFTILLGVDYSTGGAEKWKPVRYQAMRLGVSIWHRVFIERAGRAKVDAQFFPPYDWSMMPSMDGVGAF